MISKKRKIRYFQWHMTTKRNLYIELNRILASMAMASVLTSYTVYIINNLRMGNNV